MDLPPLAEDAAAPITCDTCQACCCRLEVLLMGEDDIPDELTEQDRWGGWVMARLDDGLCAALVRETHRCSIYAIRPQVCRDYAAGDADCRIERAHIDFPPPGKQGRP